MPAGLSPTGRFATGLFAWSASWTTRLPWLAPRPAPGGDTMLVTVTGLPPARLGHETVEVTWR